MSNILVTGGSGFIGSHIIETLKDANHKVFNIDRTKSNFGDIFEDIDINHSSKVEEFLKKNEIEYVYHIAAIANARRSLENVHETMVNNVAGTASILNACANAKIKKVHVFGENIKNTFYKINKEKRGKILKDIKEIINLIKNEINDKEYLMIKGSNSTGLNNLLVNFKKRTTYAV